MSIMENYFKNCDYKVFIFLIIAMISSQVLFFSFSSLNLSDLDTGYYLKLSNLQFSTVTQPYIYRALVPVALGIISRNLEVPVILLFDALAIISLVVFMVVLKKFSEKWNLGNIVILAFAFSGFSLQFGLSVMTDPASAAVIALSLLVLYGRQKLLGGILAAVSVGIRDTNISFAVFVIGYLLFSKNYRSAVVCVASSAVMFYVTRYFGSLGLSNVHGMPTGVYLVGKIFMNFVTQDLGIRFWTNTFAWCEDPIATWILPERWALGNMRAIGVCAWDPQIPLVTLFSAMTVFGVMPSIFLSLIRENRNIIKDSWVFMVFSYGFVMFILGFCTGFSVYRLIGYSWPLWILGISKLISERKSINISAGVMACHLLTFILHGYYIFYATLAAVNISLFTFLVLDAAVISMHVYTYKVCRGGEKTALGVSF